MCSVSSVVCSVERFVSDGGDGVYGVHLVWPAGLEGWVEYVMCVV